jgi:hypothetical protein
MRRRNRRMPRRGTPRLYTLPVFSSFNVRLQASCHLFSPPSLPFFSLLITFLYTIKKLSQKKILIPNFVTTFAPKV